MNVDMVNKITDKWSVAMAVYIVPSREYTLCVCECVRFSLLWNLFRWFHHFSSRSFQISYKQWIDKVDMEKNEIEKKLNISFYQTERRTQTSSTTENSRMLWSNCTFVAHFMG